ncbi:hypothetical protein BG261_02935 [Floricoccus tropicus]|uniref:Uncharacterized protein n=1 Tax=Floricoccus tropicus TaxID=1859473 RepID=A0A1E8GMT0_9LACT|nr:hypothetical protein [Floricoccus tropicus]OFI49550.1 hypothetical protein BG261_02935 [Floricoccus tropicus]
MAIILKRKCDGKFLTYKTLETDAYGTKEYNGKQYSGSNASKVVEWSCDETKAIRYKNKIKAQAANAWYDARFHEMKEIN